MATLCFTNVCCSEIADKSPAGLSHAHAKALVLISKTQNNLLKRILYHVANHSLHFVNLVQNYVLDYFFCGHISNK